MGTAGTSIFADDDAADVRATFQHYVADAQDVAAATEAIAKDFGASFASPQHHTAFWLSLALTQWKAGWLDPRAKEAALRVIDDGSDLAKWGEGRDATRRAAALQAARDTLEAMPPPARALPKPWPIQLADFQTGEIIGRPLPQGRLAVMKVVGFRRTLSLKVRGPAVRLQKWLSPVMPTAAEATMLEYLRWPVVPSGTRTLSILVLTAPRRTPLNPDQFLRPGVTAPLTPNEVKGGYHSVSEELWPVDDLLASAVARWWENPGLSASAPPPWRKG